MVIDSASFAENAYFIKVLKGYADKTIKEIVPKCSVCRCMTMSSKKDALLIGGLIAMRSRSFGSNANLSHYVRGICYLRGMSGLDMNALAVGLEKERSSTTSKHELNRWVPGNRLKDLVYFPVPCWWTCHFC